MFLSFILAITQFLLITIIVFQEYRRKSIGVFLWAMLLILFGIMHLSTVVANYHDYPMWVYNHASLFVILFCLFYMVTRKILIPSSKALCISFDDWSKDNYQFITSLQKRFIYCILFFLFASVFYKIYEVAQYSGSILNSSWGSKREMVQSNSYVNAGRIVEPIYWCATSSVLLFMYWGKKKWAVISAFLILACVIVIRSRSQILPLLVAVISYYIYNGSKLSMKKIIILFSFTIISVITIYAIQIFRYYGSILNFIIEFDSHVFFDRIFTNIAEGEGDIGLREVFYYFIYHDNQFENFGQGHTYIRMFMLFIPTQWSAGLKPPDFAISMGSALGIGDAGFSTHPTLFGDCFANFGYWGVLMGIFWAILVFWADKFSNSLEINLKISSIVLFANTYIIIGRGSVYNAYSWSVYGLLVMLFVYYVLKRIPRNNNSKRVRIC